MNYPNGMTHADLEYVEGRRLDGAETWAHYANAVEQAGERLERAHDALEQAETNVQQARKQLADAEDDFQSHASDEIEPQETPDEFTGRLLGELDNLLNRPRGTR